jgi:hypothetical protein
MSHFLSDELIFHKNGGEFVSAGFGINSILLNKGLAPLLTFTKDYDDNSDSDSDSDSSSSSDSDDGIKKKVFKSYKNLAIPIGLYLDDSSKHKHSGEYGHVSENIKQIPDDIYDELMKLIHYDEKQKRQSRKKKMSSAKKNKSSKNVAKRRK